MPKESLDKYLLHSYLKWKGVYDWNSIQRFMRGWLEKNHYTVHETKMKEKPGQYGLEIEWKMEGHKQIDGFYKYWINWFLRIWDQEKVEVVKDGTKKMMDTGRMRIIFNATVEYDYEGQFDSSRFFTKMRNFLTKNIIKEDLESVHIDGLYYELNRFKNDVEAHITMETATEGSLYHG